MSLLKKIFKSKKNKTLNTSYEDNQSNNNSQYDANKTPDSYPFYQEDDNSITFVSSEELLNTTKSNGQNDSSIVPNNEVIATQIEPQKNIIEEQEENFKKQALNKENKGEFLAKIKPKKLSIEAIKSKINKVEEKKNNDSTKKELSELTRKEYEERIDKILDSMVQLLTPFKDILLKNVPSSKYIIRILEKIAILISFVAKKIFLNVPIALRFIKSKLFKFVISVSFVLFLIGILLSRVLSGDSYKKNLERNIYNATGYETEINGKVQIAFVPYIAITLDNVAFYTDNTKTLSAFGVSQVNTQKLYIKIKFLPLLLGKIVVSEINLTNFSLNVKSSSLENNLTYKYYEEILNNIENQLLPYRANVINFDNHQIPTPELITLDKEIPKVLIEEKNHVKKPYNSSSSIDLLMEYLVNSIELDLNKINYLHLQRGKINFLNQSNQRAISFDNLNSSLSKSGNNIEIAGSSLFNGMNTDYVIKLNNINNSIVDFNFQMIFDHNDDAIRIKGKMDPKNHIFSGQINAKYSILYLINKFIYPVSTKIYNSEFSGNFNLNPHELLIKDYKLQIDKEIITGDFLWDYGINNYIKLNVNSNVSNLNPIFAEITDKAIAGNTLFFIGLAKNIGLLKNEQINLFKPNHYDLTLNITDSYLNNTKIEKLSLNAILTNNKDIYINKLELNNSTTNLKMLGKFNIETADANIIINSNGDIVNSLKLYGISSQGQDLIDLINTSKDYNLNALLLFDNSKNYIAFSDINGMFGNIKINPSVLTLKYIDNTINSTLSIPMDTLNINKIENVYKTHIKNGNYNNAEKSNLFGLKDNDVFNLHINANKVIYNEYPLNQGVLELQMHQYGFKVNKFEVNSSEGGKITAIMTLDTTATPKIFGSFSFNDLYVDLAKMKGFVFEDKNLVGNLILNGNLKFNNESLEQIFNNLNGSLTLIKEERIKFNRFAENSTIYLTITESTKGKNTQYFLNDIAGQLNVVNNIITIENVGMRYFKGKLEYRGTFKGTYNTLNQNLDINGAMDNAIDTSKRIEFSGKGDILQPKFSSKSLVLKDRLALQKKEKAKTKTLANELDESDFYAKSRNATNFRNPYRDQDKESQAERNRLYEELINNNPQSQE
jgi:hypothetical protein